MVTYLIWNAAEDPVLCKGIHHPRRLHDRKSLTECSHVPHFALREVGADDVRHGVPREVVDHTASVVQHNLLQLLARGDGEAVDVDGDAREEGPGSRGGGGRVGVELRGELAVLGGHVAPEVGERGGGEGAARVLGGGGGGVGVGKRRAGVVFAPRPLLARRGGHRQRRRRGAAAGGGAHGGRKG